MSHVGLTGTRGMSGDRHGAPDGAAARCQNRRRERTDRHRRLRAPPRSGGGRLRAAHAGARGGRALAAGHALLSGRARPARRPTAGCARRFSATATGSCTARRSGGSSTRPRCSSPRAATTTARGSPTRSRSPRSRARWPARWRSTRTWSRRSGSATTSATRRSATSARRRWTAACASASARAFLHHEHSLRVVDSLERDGQGLNLTDAGARRDRQPLRPGRAAGDARGQDRPARRPRRLHQPRHRRRAARRGDLRRATCPRSRSRSSATPARGGSTRSSTTWSSTPRRAGDIVQGEPVGGAMAELRTFMFERRLPGAGGHARARQDPPRDPRAVRPLLRPPGGDPAPRSPTASWPRG